MPWRARNVARPLRAVLPPVLAAVAAGCLASPLAAGAPAAPRPLSPPAGAVLPQDNLQEACTVFGVSWDFTWQPAPGAAQYQLLVEHAGVPMPVYSAVYPRTSLARVGKCGCFDESMLSDWSWKVRAQSDAGQWGPWSEPVAFSVQRFAGCLKLHEEQ
jgi:hypothetical protein